MKGVDIERHLDEQQRSGKNVASYCSENGIPVSKFYSWKQRKIKPATGFARVLTNVTVEIEVGAAKLHVHLESLNAVLSELEKR